MINLVYQVVVSLSLLVFAYLMVGMLVCSYAFTMASGEANTPWYKQVLITTLTLFDNGLFSELIQRDFLFLVLLSHQ